MRGNFLVNLSSALWGRLHENSKIISKGEMTVFQLFVFPMECLSSELNLEETDDHTSRKDDGTKKGNKKKFRKQLLGHGHVVYQHHYTLESVPSYCANQLSLR